VVTPEGVGDLVFLLPTLRALKESLPAARIQLSVSAVQKHLAATIEGNLVEVVSTYRHGSGFGQLTHLVDAVRRFAPDLYLELEGGFRYGVVGLLSSAARRIHPPREQTRRYAAWIHPETFPFNPSRHRVDTLLALLDRLGIRRTRTSFEFDIPDQYRQKADAIARQYIPPGSIALIPTSGHKPKDWPDESLQETVNILSRDLGRTVVILGKEQRPVRVNNAIDLGDVTDFLTDACLLRYSGVFDVAVGVDTGMMQIAGSISSDPYGSYDRVVGNKTVSLFGPTDPAMYRPYDPTRLFNLVVTPKTKSRAMGTKGYAGDRFERAYMKEIAAREIVDRVSQQLTARGHERRLKISEGIGSDAGDQLELPAT
jgi:ADP-heptose:LPS heptosyltransferase